MAKDLQEEITTMIYNYGLGVGPDSGTLASRIVSKVKRQLTKRVPDRLAGGGRKHPARAIKQIRKLLVKHGGR